MSQVQRCATGSFLIKICGPSGFFMNWQQRWEAGIFTMNVWVLNKYHPEKWQVIVLLTELWGLTHLKYLKIPFNLFFDAHYQSLTSLVLHIFQNVAVWCKKIFHSWIRFPICFQLKFPWKSQCKAWHHLKIRVWTTYKSYNLKNSWISFHLKIIGKLLKHTV